MLIFSCNSLFSAALRKILNRNQKKRKKKKKKIKKEAGPYSGLKMNYEQVSTPGGKNKLLKTWLQKYSKKAKNPSAYFLKSH